MIDKTIITTSGDYYKILDNIIENNFTKYLVLNLCTRKVETINPSTIDKFINPSNYILIKNKIVENSNENIIKELKNKIDFKKIFGINKNSDIETLLNTDVLIEEINNILIEDFYCYIHDEICSIRKIVGTIKQKNLITTYH